MITDGLVVHELELPAAREDVFLMFTAPAQLVRWIGITAELEPRPGGRFRFEVVPGQYCEGKYIDVEPPARLAFTWGWTDPWFNLPPGMSRVDVELTETSHGTHLRLVHELPDAVRVIHDEGWTQFLSRLDAVMRGVYAGPYPVGDPDERQRDR